MHPVPVSLLLAVALAGCAAPGADRAPVCDGLHRRPANPSLAPPASARRASSVKDVELATSYVRCGARS